MKNNGSYFNHLSGTSEPCEIVIFGNKIYVYSGENKSTLLIWDMKNSFFEWRGSSLIVSKGDEKLECSGEIARNLEKLYNGHQTVAEKKPFRLRPVHLFFLSIGMVLIGASLLVYFYAVPWVAEKTAAFVPVDLEIKIGEKISESLTSDAISNDSVNYYSDKFVKNLKLDTDYPVQVRIISSDEINAFAVPGGRIFIYSGLLAKMDSYEQLVALIGHELTHVTKQHSLKSIFRGAASGIVIGGLFGDMGGLGTWVLSKADEFKQLHYSRELETEADNYGLQMMINNKVDPKGMLALLKLLKEEGQEAPELMKYLSTHPDTEARIANILANPSVNDHFPGQELLRQSFVDLQRSLGYLK